MSDLQKIRRESLRWVIILTLNNARPGTFHEKNVLRVLQTEYPDATLVETRRELEYLLERNLVKIDKQPSDEWICSLTRYGIDVADYTLPVEPGIARPVKYFHA